MIKKVLKIKAQDPRIGDIFELLEVSCKMLSLKLIKVKIIQESIPTAW